MQLYSPTITNELVVSCMCKIHDSLPGYELPQVKQYVDEDSERSSGSVSLIEDNLHSQSNNNNNSNNNNAYVVDNADWLLTAKDFVLRKCCQSTPLQFEQCYPKSLLQNCQKIGEGVYGEVFLYRNQNGQTTVMKIIPIEGDQIVNGEPQKTYEEILSEILIADDLSNLRTKTNNQTSAFIKLQNIQCVQGRYPEQLLELWELFEETRGSENDSPEIFKDDQLYVILEFTYGGLDIESFEFQNAYQSYLVFKQVAYAFAVAEEELQFEHRDLHWGNILVKSIDVDEKVTFKLGKYEINLETNGLKASIIDFTMSRIEVDGVVIFSDLRQDPSVFSADGDYQFEIYRMMQQRNGNEWEHFEPYTNILWLHYILDKAITGLRYKKPKCKLHKQYINKMKEMKIDILSYDSAKDFVNGYF